MTARPAKLAPSSRGRRSVGAAQYRGIADFAPVMIWAAAPDRRCTYLNRRWVEFTGRPAAEHLGDGWLDCVHSDDRERCRAAYERAFATVQPFEIEYRLRRADGEHRWVVARGVPLVEGGALTGFVGSCLDVSERREAQDAARKREEDFRALAENLPDVIIRLDRSLRFLYVNRAAESLFGRARDEIVGRGRGEIGLPPPLAGALTEAASCAFGTGTEQRFEIASGERHLSGRLVPERGEGGEVDAILAILYDVTARMHEDERRAQLLARERNARAHAESASFARDQFLAIVSHELRSPLNGIKSWTHVLENLLHDASAPVRRALAGIMIGVEHQVRLIEDLLDVTRAMSGTLGLVKHPMPIMPVLAEAVEGMRAMAIEKDLRVVADYDLGEREMHGDPDRVRQIFANLLTNAVKFTPPGGTITIAARAENAMACIEVRDNGVGIPPEFAPYLFDPFRQADQGSSNRRQEGLGLGLALVQRLAELHGGHVTCESEGIDRGAAFRVYLPLTRDSGGRVVLPDAHRGEQGASTLPSLDGIRVLLIDDQREARESLGALLTQAGAEVELAASGAEAMSCLENGRDGHGPDVVVCDIAMPDEDGYQTLKRIRRWESTQGPLKRPAIALTAFTQREDRVKALAEGFQVHLTKPVAPAELIIVIASVARRTRI
jgi:PAS domain S-box-containing protein